MPPQPPDRIADAYEAKALRKVARACVARANALEPARRHALLETNMTPEQFTQFVSDADLLRQGLDAALAKIAELESQVSSHQRAADATLNDPGAEAVRAAVAASAAKLRALEEPPAAPPPAEPPAAEPAPEVDANIGS